MLIEKPHIVDENHMKNMERTLYNIAKEVGPKKRGIVNYVKPKPPNAKNAFKLKHFSFLQNDPKNVIELDNPGPTQTK